MLGNYNRYEIAAMGGLAGLVTILFADFAIGGWKDGGIGAFLEMLFVVIVFYGAFYGLYYKENLSASELDELPDE